jgi:lycopene beta-cyclase
VPAPAPATSSTPLVAGYQGGWFHPATGYSLPPALRLARHVAAHPPDELFGPAWSALCGAHERQARYFLLLNRMLFGAYRADDRWRVFERFYGLPAPTIRRFYAMATTRLDQLRILSRPARGFSLGALLAR